MYENNDLLRIGLLLGQLFQRLAHIVERKLGVLINPKRGEAVGILSGSRDEQQIQ